MPGPTLIQIKRSINTGTTPTLANGELAFTANGDILFIGSNAVTIPIGSKRTPGVLTANQAIVTNTTNMVDTIRFGNTTVNVVANGTQVTLANSTINFGLIKPDSTQFAGNYYLKADGSWSTVSAGSAAPAGANTQVQYNDSGVTAGSVGLTYDETTNNITVANSVFLGTGTANVVANTTLVRLANSTVTFDITRPTAAQNTAGNYFLGSNGFWQQITPPATNLDGLTDVTIASIANNDLLVYDNVAGQWENHATGNGISFAGQVAAIVGANGISVTTAGINVLANNGIVANTTGVFANIGSTLAFTSGAIGVNTNLSITDLSLSGNLNVTGTLSTVDAVNLVVNDSIISLARNNGADLLDIGFYGQYNDGAERFTGLIWDTTDDSYYLFANTSTEPTTTLSIADANLRYSVLRSYLISNGFVSNSTAVNITATGSIASALTINTLSVQAQSNLAGQVANSIGFFPTSNTVGQQFGNTISRWNITGNTIVLAGQSANSLGLYPVSNTVGQLFGNTISRWEITANTLALSTALLGTSGGTGLASIADQAILKGNSTNGYTALALGTAGLVLQSFGGALIYDTLDGGTF